MILFVEYFFFGINAPFPNPDQLWEARSLPYRLFCVNPLTHKLTSLLPSHILAYRLDLFQGGRSC